MIEIEIDQNFSDQLEISGLQAVADKVLAITETSLDSEIGLQIIEDAQMQELNLQYMGINSPTDVLSFPVPFQNPDTGNPYLGDILISYPTAARQAEAAGHPVAEEISLLLVHGILHLLGYDHLTTEDKTAMWDIQDTILTALQINARPTE
ncbi:MAG TPA: rRNA maturation RNase YbeY [Anaerolineales bacterium]|jgi:probable rRNA maturation factor|nr:rRNA maturation RNase YbeY [Anaerolineales bacterium]